MPRHGVRSGVSALFRRQSDVPRFSEGLAAVSLATGYGFIDHEGMTIRPILSMKPMLSERSIVARVLIPGPVAERLAARMTASELTGGELEVLEQIVGGKSNKEIATHFGRSEATVKSHINNILGKLL